MEIEALLIKEPGFEKAVEVWVEGHPEARGRFRADQHFGPSGDGDNINIPVVRLQLRIPAGTARGEYAVRLRGRVEGEAGAVVEGLSTLLRNRAQRTRCGPAGWASSSPVGAVPARPVRF